LRYDTGKIKNINELLCIGSFGVPPTGEATTKEDYIKILKDTNQTVHQYQNKDGYHIVKGLRHEHITPGRESWDVEYKYNSDLFRSDHFKKDHDGLHIIFSGCSSTEGVGIKQEQTWAYNIYNELSKTKKLDGYYNLGQSNTGYHQVIGNFMTYVSKYGKPDYLFVLLPNIQRRYEYLEDKDSWTYTSHAQPNDNPKDHPCLDSNDYMSIFPVWAKIWTSFINYCNANDIKIFWSTWDMIDRLNIERSGIFKDSYVSIESFNDPALIKERIESNGLQDKDLYARDEHPGPLANYLWSKNFLDKIKKDGLL
jgi:hypothetical protein